MKDATKQKFAAFGQRLAVFAKRNYLMLGYILAALLIELTGVAVTSGRFYMTEPWLFFSFVALACLASLYIPGHNRRYALFVTLLALNFALDMLFIVVYDSTGTIFDYAMLNLRTDAMTIVESIPISFAYVFITALIIALYCTLGVKLKKKMLPPVAGKLTYAVTAGLLALVLGAEALLIYFGNYKTNANDLSFRLYQNETGTYSNKGIVGNLANELARGLWFSDVEAGDLDELYGFVYEKETAPTDKFGKAKDYNVVTVLCESFEWFTFLADAERYPNGYAKLLKSEAGEMTGEQLNAALRELYPNLYRFYEDRSTVVLDNSYSLEKTDISENKSIIGNYPLYEYINYKYPKNAVVYSLPNILKGLYGVESNSFHDGYKTFYNRNEHHTNALGFESFTASEDMGLVDEDSMVGERTLDTDMMSVCLEEMFPKDRRFNTYITTITQHGQYAYRENLKPYYEKMDALGILPYTEGDDNGNALRYYCAAGMNLDAAIGMMLDYLRDNDLLSNTLITLFGDHNCYYQGVSNYVKNIYSYDAENYTELYRVPVMIKVGGEDMGNAHINKFTCLSDVYPTILDLLGIKGYKNLMYGVSAFSEESSVLYSRAYDKFITDNIYFNSLNHIIYQKDKDDEEYVKETEEKCKLLLEKISHVNRLFAGDCFSGEGGTVFFDNMKKLNNLTVTAV